jgi:hypothetical protein
MRRLALKDPYHSLTVQYVSPISTAKLPSLLTKKTTRAMALKHSDYQEFKHFNQGKIELD